MHYHNRSVDLMLLSLRKVADPLTVMLQLGNMFLCLVFPDCELSSLSLKEGTTVYLASSLTVEGVKCSFNVVIYTLSPLTLIPSLCTIDYSREPPYHSSLLLVQIYPPPPSSLQCQGCHSAAAPFRLCSCVINTAGSLLCYS